MVASGIQYTLVNGEVLCEVAIIAAYCPAACCAHMKCETDLQEMEREELVARDQPEMRHHHFFVGRRQSSIS
jgi:hypothetical protein